MYINCPFCRQQYELDEDLVGQTVACANCGKNFVVGKPYVPGGQGEKRSSSSKLTRIAAVIVVVLLVVLVVSSLAALGLYKFFLRPRYELWKVQNDFRNEVADRIGKEVGDPKSVSVRWHVSVVSPERDVFFGICEVRGAKNISQPITCKICARSGKDGMKIGIAEFPDGDISRYQKLDWEKICAVESSRRDMLYADLLKDVRQKTEAVEKRLKGISVSATDGDDIEALKRREIRILEIVRDITHDHGDSLILQLKKTGERKFYSLLLEDSKVKEDELAKANDGLSALAQRGLDIAKSVQKAIEEKERIREEKERKRLEAAKRAEREKKRLKVLAHLTVAAMVDEAIIDYKRRHAGALPSKYSVEQYEKHVASNLRSIVREYDNMRISQRKIAEFGTPKSDRERIELQELEKEMQRHVGEFENAFEKLLEGISCDASSQNEFASGGEKCASCSKFRFPPSHIKIDFRHPDTSKLEEYFSQYDGYSSRHERLSADEVNAYLTEHPEIKERLRFGIPDTTALPESLRRKLQKSASAGKSAADDGRDKENKVCVKDIVTANAKSILWKTHLTVSVQCGYCGGIGETSYLVENPNYDPRKLGSSPDIRVMQKCKYCRGRKKVKVFERCRTALIPKEVREKLRANLLSERREFCDFTIGADFDRELSGKRFYSRNKLLLVAQNPFGYTYYYRGNHKYDDVELTVLTQNFGVLTQVELFTQRESLVSGLGGRSLQLPVFFKVVQSPDKLPFSRKGTLLFEPEMQRENGRRRGRFFGNESVDDVVEEAKREAKCRVFVIYAVHPSILSTNFPHSGEKSFPGQWICRSEAVE